MIAHYLAKHDACAEERALSATHQPRVPMYAAISSYWMDRVPDADRLIEMANIPSDGPDAFIAGTIRMKRDKGAVEDLERFDRRASWPTAGEDWAPTMSSPCSSAVKSRPGRGSPSSSILRRSEGSRFSEQAKRLTLMTSFEISG